MEPQRSISFFPKKELDNEIQVVSKDMIIDNIFYVLETVNILIIKNIKDRLVAAGYGVVMERKME